MKRGVLIFVGIFLIVIVAGFAFASLNPAVPNPGHSVSELQKCSNGEILKMTNGVWACVAESGGSSVWQQSGSIVYYNGGNVGIGTSSPNARLVVSSINTGKGLLILHNQQGSVSNTNGIDFVHYTTNYLQAYVRDEIVSGWGAKLHFGTATGTVDATTRMTIDNYGNVGIGTTSPTALLHVSRYISSGQPQTIAIFGQKTSSTMERGLEIMGGDSNGGFYGIKAHGTDASFFIANQAGIKNLVVTAGGKVGIGTISPTEALDVAGNIKASGTICDGAHCMGDYLPLAGGTMTGNLRVTGASTLDDDVTLKGDVRMEGTSMYFQLSESASPPGGCDINKRGAVYFDTDESIAGGDSWRIPCVCISKNGAYMWKPLDNVQATTCT
jgi:hypothetical protein